MHLLPLINYTLRNKKVPHCNFLYLSLGWYHEGDLFCSFSLYLLPEYNRCMWCTLNLLKGYSLKLYRCSLRSRTDPWISFKCPLLYIHISVVKVTRKSTGWFGLLLSHGVSVLSSLALDNPEMLGIMGSRDYLW